MDAINAKIAAYTADVTKHATELKRIQLKKGIMQRLAQLIV